MDRIDTFQDLLNLLDSKPEWVKELRARLLTEELIALPEQFARFAAAVNKRFDALEKDVSELKAGQEELKAGQTRMEERQTRTEERLTRIEDRQTRMEADISELKGQMTPLIARRMVGKIAEVTNSRRPRWMEDIEIIDIADNADTTGVPPNELESFRAIDLALRAVDKSGSDGDPQYIIIECSYSVNHNDVRRAKRNADYMSQFTGTPTKAVVIGNRISDDVASAADKMSVVCITVTNKSARPR